MEAKMANKRRGNSEGSLQQRPNGRWRVQVSIQGKRLSFSAKTRSECQQWLKNTQKQIDAGLTFAGAQQTLLEYLEGWLVSIKPTIRPHTWLQYRSGVLIHITPVLGNITLKDLQADKIQQFYEFKLKSGAGKRTVEILHSILHKALKQAVKMGTIGRNPTDATTPPRPVEKEMKFLDESQVSQLLLAAKGDRNEALYYLAIATGLRQSELLGLQWSDLDWQKHTLTVQRQAKREGRNEGYFAPLKTRASRRTLVLGKKMIERLREHYDRQRYEIQSEKNWKNLDLIFPSIVGTPQYQHNLYCRFLDLVERAGLPRIRFHDLRHAAASLMLNHGVPVIIVSRRLGHSKVSITLDIYGHMFPEMQNEAAEMIDDLITPVEVEIPKNNVRESLAVYG
jgi:integrase